MRHLWRTRGVFGLLLVAMVVVGPQAGWPKGERPSHVMRLENGVMRGVVKAATQAVLYAQIQGRVSQVPFKEGQRFEKGTHAGANRLWQVSRRVGCGGSRT